MPDLVTNAQVLAGWPGLARLDPIEQAALLTAASRAIERYCNRTFAVTAYTETHSGRNLPRVWLANRPVVAVTSVTVDGQALDNTTGDAWTVTPETGELLRGGGRGDPRFAPWFPWGRNNIVVAYTAGFATVPADVQLAARYLVQHMSESRKGIGPIRSETIGDYAYQLEGGGGWPAAVTDLLRFHVLTAGI